jgi:hypothetical protein
MIHFDFVVTENDAEVIFACINHQINSNDYQIIDFMDLKKDKYEEHVGWYTKHNEYLKELKTKMLNSKV